PGELARLALELGADLPVCLAGGPRFVGGVGDDLAPVPVLPPAHLVLVNPGVPLSTAAVFGARAGAFSAPARWRDMPADAAALARRLAACGNDLADAAHRLAPPIDAVLAALAGCRGCLVARLSGSGATCFGLFAAAAEAESAAAAVAAAQPSWWVAAAPMLTADHAAG
ncbi:MAG TPA: 4-(cytidine 5'-diphospho)-2-C-methyl-D-erythritol kinase, partial [Dongiaceae bacterium]|nr:4-(cytidine 5'-diphospho)-2-C-methyl-D-erythritol kinase [Dongiaceae bacterium]